MYKHSAIVKTVVLKPKQTLILVFYGQISVGLLQYCWFFTTDKYHVARYHIEVASLEKLCFPQQISIKQ